ncbi:hypothetical protein [Chromobacterium amazonense]|uniref:Uncharacterized protein n=1 Tax=Chromobacterium amazonense TaxID=1382803 RepID=A0ABU8V2D9_9NEIS|nr:hypothetical protein [Chromobacterium amazonense]MDQ4538864.1 hypothetical protein [Chromobacterium amazonense]
MNTPYKSVEIIISNSGTAIPIENRPAWRLLIIIICLKILSTDGYGLSSNKIRIGSWMALRKEKWKNYLDFLYGLDKLNSSIMPDQQLDKAISLGICKNYWDISKTGRIELTTDGERLFDMITTDNAMSDEIEFLSEIKTKLTENLAKEIIGE